MPGLCKCGDVGQYKCPRCDVPYCSLSCYKAPTHLNCSELFYKEQVEKELTLRSASDKDKEKMNQVLEREYLARGGEEELGEAEGLSDLMKNIDLKSEEELWDMLTVSEQEAFLKSVKSGSIATLLKPKRLWWDTGSLVYKPTKIPLFKDICTREPSPYLKYMVLQVVLSYVQLELMFPNKREVLPEYWSTFSLLWEHQDPNVCSTAAAACLVYTERTDSAGLQKYAPVEEVLDAAVKVLTLGQLAAERCCCELLSVLSKTNKTNSIEATQHRKMKKKLQFYASWCASPHGTALLQVAAAVAHHAAQVRSEKRKLAADSQSEEKRRLRADSQSEEKQRLAADSQSEEKRRLRADSHRHLGESSGGALIEEIL